MFILCIQENFAALANAFKNRAISTAGCKRACLRAHAWIAKFSSMPACMFAVFIKSSWKTGKGMHTYACMGCKVFPACQVCRVFLHAASICTWCMHPNFKNRKWLCMYMHGLQSFPSIHTAWVWCTILVRVIHTTYQARVGNYSRFWTLYGLGSVQTPPLCLICILILMTVASCR